MNYGFGRIVAALLVLASTGCATTGPDASQVQWYPKPSNAYAQAQIRTFLGSRLIDPESLRLECTDVSERAWVWPGVGFGHRYGYLVICNVNARNRLGGYAGAQRYVFRFNGPEFAHEDVVPRMGLVTQ